MKHEAFELRVLGLGARAFEFKVYFEARAAAWHTLIWRWDVAELCLSSQMKMSSVSCGCSIDVSTLQSLMEHVLAQAPCINPNSRRMGWAFGSRHSMFRHETNCTILKTQ